MAEMFANGRIIDIILGLVAIELVALILLRRAAGRGPAIAALLPNLLSGVSLMLALRIALTGGNWVWIAACLLAALIFHGIDLAIRFRTGK